MNQVAEQEALQETPQPEVPVYSKQEDLLAAKKKRIQKLRRLKKNKDRVESDRKRKNQKASRKHNR